MILVLVIMKNSLYGILLIALLIPFGQALAQDSKKGFPRFEVSLSGAYGLVQYDYSTSDGSSSDVITLKPYYLPVSAELSFMYFPKPWLSVGLGLGNDRNSIWLPPSTKWLVDLTPYVRFHWLRKRNFTAYSGLGYTFVLPAMFEDSYYWKFWWEAMQYNPIGITFGRSFFGFAELGFGSRQDLSYPLRVGVGYRF